MANIFDIPIDLWENHITTYAQAKLKLTCKHFGEIKHKIREVNRDTFKDIIETYDYPSLCKFNAKWFANASESQNYVELSLKVGAKNITVYLANLFRYGIISDWLLTQVALNDDPYIISKMKLVPSRDKINVLYQQLFENGVLNYIKLRGNDHPRKADNSRADLSVIEYMSTSKLVLWHSKEFSERNYNFVKYVCEFGLAKTCVHIRMPVRYIRRLSKYFVSRKMIIASIKRGVLPDIDDNQLAINDVYSATYKQFMDLMFATNVLTQTEYDGLMLLAE